VLAVLHRHLLAILHRAFAGPRTMKEWKAIATPGAFDMTRIKAYLDRVHDRMDLFHPTHPFAQARGLVGEFGADFIDPIDTLTTERSSWGTARSLFHHRLADQQPFLLPGEAARVLLVHHAFGTGGLVRKPNEPTSATASPLVRAAVVLLRGESLFRTLLANLLRYDPAASLPIPGNENDLPSWEQPPPPVQLRVAKELSRLPDGWLDLLTWLSRRIELVEEGGKVTGYVRAVWQGLPETAPQDPMVAYRIDAKRGLVSLGLNPDRALWRDANAFFEAGRTDPRFLRPKTIDQAATSQALEWLGEGAAFSLEIHGLSAYQSRVDLVRSERVGAAVQHFSEPEARDTVERALTKAEAQVDALQKALWSYARHLLSQGDRKPETKDISSLANSLGAGPAVWSALGVEFDQLLRGLDGGQSVALATFSRSCRAVIDHAFQSAVDSADSTARSLKARALAKRSLDEALAALVN
jgi:CRISPR system Cascade subunit CasA